MRLQSVLIWGITAILSAGAHAQQTSTHVPTPKTISAAQLAKIVTMEGVLIQMSALVRHTDTVQVFTIGENHPGAPRTK